MLRNITALALALCFVAAPALAADGGSMSDDEKTIYAIGASMADGLSGLDLSEDEAQVLIQGLTDALMGENLVVEPVDRQNQIRQLAQARQQRATEREKAEAGAFLEEVAAKKDIQKFDSGLLFQTLEEGDGASPAATDTVRVHYHGTLRTGKTFDSSYERGQPAEFPLNRVIPCWTEALQKMKVGGKARIWCPSDIAYGDMGRPPKIPGGAPLVFEVELLEIKGQ